MKEKILLIIVVCMVVAFGVACDDDCSDCNHCNPRKEKFMYFDADRTAENIRRNPEPAKYRRIRKERNRLKKELAEKKKLDLK